jgi:hypothetical protein
MPKDDLLIGQPKPQTLRLSEHPSYECECGCKLFTNVVVVKKIPGLLVGNPDMKEVPIPVDMLPIMICSKCGKLAPFLKDNKEFMEAYAKITKEPDSEKKPSEDKKEGGLIIP